MSNAGYVGIAATSSDSVAPGVWTLKEAALAQKNGAWPLMRQYIRIRSTTPGSSGSAVSISEWALKVNGVFYSLSGYPITNLGAGFSASYPITNLNSGGVSNLALVDHPGPFDVYVAIPSEVTPTHVLLAPQSGLYHMPLNLKIYRALYSLDWTEIASFPSIGAGWVDSTYREFATGL